MNEKYYFHPKIKGYYEHTCVVKNDIVICMICIEHDQDNYVAVYKDSNFRPNKFKYAAEYKEITREGYDRWIAERAFIEAL